VPYPDSTIGDTNELMPAGLETYMLASCPPVMSVTVTSADTTIAFPLDKVTWIARYGDALASLRYWRSADRDTLYVYVAALGSGGSYVTLKGLQACDD